MTQKKILVTSALPYANGHLHLGHLVEHIQTDIWVRVQKMLGHQCIAVCADDAHGTPIMLKAEALNMTAEALTSEMKQSHERDFHAFSIVYDHYHTTHSEENKTLVCDLYERLKARGDIVKKTIRQAYDPVKSLFLPDRYVKGTCPKCHADGQYGDNCEACGATYSPTDLINPVSVLSGATPIEKESEHYFFDLPQYADFLKTWLHTGTIQSEVANKMNEWLKEGLKQWDISRDAPYFGFAIPGCVDKYFYVWMDAPIGYMASFKAYCDKIGESFSDYWGEESSAELYHFIGKDIIYFHALFWPALLKGARFRLPTAIYAHGFLTINGQKMSKSRGTFIEARTYLAHLNPNYLRYYFAAKLNGRVDDLDLNFDDFITRVNADLVGKLINIASRSAGFIQKYFNHQLSETLHQAELYTQILALREPIIEAYIDRDYARAIRQIMEGADWVNQYIDAHKPWALVKMEEHLLNVQKVCTMGLNLFRLLITYLKPVLPDIAFAVSQFLNEGPLNFDALDTPLLGHTISSFSPLLQRIDRADVDAMLTAASEHSS